MSMADRDGFIWYDGKLVAWRDATAQVLTHSLHYGGRDPHHAHGLTPV